MDDSDEDEDEDSGEDEDEDEGEDSDEDACNVCKSPEDDESMLACGDGEGKGCDRCFHIHCLSPLLAAIPDDDWFCAKCSGKEAKAENDDDEGEDEDGDED